MGRSVRIKMEIVDTDSGEILESKNLKQRALVEPKSIADLGLSHKEQIGLLQSIQDKIIQGETDFLKSATRGLSRV